MLKDVIRNCSLIDFGEEISLGSDQAYVYYSTIEFPTVTFRLIATDMLDAVVETMRRIDGYTEDGTVYYKYYLVINGYATTQMGQTIHAVVCDTDTDDAVECYDIQLTESEQSEIYAWLDVQCREYLGKSCDDLLEEARKEMP